MSRQHRGQRGKRGGFGGGSPGGSAAAADQGTPGGTPDRTPGGGDDDDDGYNDKIDIYRIETKQRVMVVDKELRAFRANIFDFLELLEDARDVAYVARLKKLIASPDLSIGDAVDGDQPASQVLLNLHQDVVKMQEKAVATCDEAMSRVRTEVAVRYGQQQLQNIQANYTAQTMNNGGGPGYQNHGDQGAQGGGNSQYKPRQETPKMLPPTPFTNELVNGVRQDPKNFMIDVLAYIENSESHVTDAQKIRFIVNYFKIPFADEWKARVARSDPTPGFHDTDDSQMSLSLFRGWFLEHTQDLGASIRHRNEFFEVTNKGVPIDVVLKNLHMMMQRCNQHMESPENHVSQKEFWKKVIPHLDERTREHCLNDSDTTTHVLHKNDPSYATIEKHVGNYLRLQQRMGMESGAALGFRHPLPARLHNMDMAEQRGTQLNNMQNFQYPEEAAHHAMGVGVAEGDDFLYNMCTAADVSDITGMPCMSEEEADDLGHIARFNAQLNSLATSNYRAERSQEIGGRGSAPTRDVSNDICNKCGKRGHWARDCRTPVAPGHNRIQPQTARRRPNNTFRQSRDYTKSTLSGARFNARPGGAQSDPARRYSFWRGGGSANAAKGNTRLTEIPITSDSLREAYKNSESIYIFDGATTPHSLEDDQLFMLA